MLGEFLGTMVLILFGNGVVAACLLEDSKAKGGGWMVITTGWAVGVFLGITTATVFGGPGSLNPAGTVAGMVTGTLAVADGLGHVAAQFAGAMTGATLVWLTYLAHWGHTADAGAKLACFCTAPAVRAPGANLLTEVIATAALVFVASALGASGAGAATPAMVGALVWGIGLSLGGPTGYAVNPARDLGPRLAHALLPIAGKGASDWGYAWVPVVGPLVGASAAALAFGALRG